MKVLFFTVLFSFSTFAFAAHGPDDFYQFSTSMQTKKMASSANQDCRAHIAKVVCLVENFSGYEKPEERVCLDGGAAYATYFEQLYDNYPPALQKMFCSLTYLFIEKTFHGTAYAGTILNPAKETVGAVMGIRKSVLDEALNLSAWASWKEQLSFGGIKDSYTLTPALPQITTASNSGVSDFLYFVVTHEFGHIFDFANKLNSTTACKPPAPGSNNSECEFAADSWGAFSWGTTLRPKPEYDFVHREKLCFYACKETFVTAAETPELFAGLYASTFISTYASNNPWDDFADSLAYYMMDKNLNTTYVIDTKHGANDDIIQKLKSSRFAPKYQYIQNFLSRTDILYP